MFVSLRSTKRMNHEDTKDTKEEERYFWTGKRIFRQVAAFGKQEFLDQENLKVIFFDVL